MAAAVAGLGLTLTACGDAPESDTAAPGESAQVDTTRVDSAIVTVAFDPSRPVDDLIFLPDSDAPWQGMIAASLSDGGYEVFNLDGEVVGGEAGPRLRSITAAPDFALRGLTIPLLFGIDSDGAVRAQAFIAEETTFIEVGLTGEGLEDNATAICHAGSGIGFVDIALLNDDETAQIWRVEDTGQDNLQLTLQSQFDLPFPARACASAGTELIVTGPTGGAARLDRDGQVVADIEGYSLADVAYGELLGRAVAIAPLGQDGQLGVFDANSMEPITLIEFEEGLNAPAILQPGAIDLTDANFGGSPFSGGLLAVYDREDGRLKLIGRDVITRIVVAPE
jgi:hypothetical protein